MKILKMSVEEKAALRGQMPSENCVCTEVEASQIHPKQLVAMMWMKETSVLNLVLRHNKLVLDYYLFQIR